MGVSPKFNACQKAMTMEIRHESSADVAVIHALTVSAFLNAPHTSHSEQLIVSRLRRDGDLTLSLVAAEAGEVVGHIAMSPVGISDGAAAWFGLGPLSVAPDHQRRGIGSRLVRHALNALRERGACGCVVLGDPAYYGRFGFMADPQLVLPGVPAEYFQAIAFNASRARGTVSYRPAFDP